MVTDLPTFKPQGILVSAIVMTLVVAAPEVKAMNDVRKQIQRSGDGSTNYLAQNITLNGVTYSEARSIALDVFNANIMQFSEVARIVATERAEELTGAFFRRLFEMAPESVGSIQEPDMQRAVFNAQEGYARSGEQGLGEILVGMLTDRAASVERDLRQITLSEAIGTAPKLASHHFTILGALLLLSNSRYIGVEDIAGFHEYLASVVAPVVDGLRVSEGDLRHLQYAGCLSVEMASRELAEIFTMNHPSLFTQGFSLDDLEEQHRSLLAPALIACKRDPEKFQIAATDKIDLRERLAPALGLESHISELDRLLNAYLLPRWEILAEISSLHSSLENLVDVWGSSSIGRCVVTNVGIALGHANIRRIVGARFSAGIEVWVQ
ncbi:LPO_1073/Vpar_1526 family protein [Streptomyces sp. NPDC051704]|uniref:LPO_1073/Vpar_1526 family protein n=1 Tax=Streptomyces sp. NPDC051704 TaxID=3365671 RepID=UPI0037B3668F